MKTVTIQARVHSSVMLKQSTDKKTKPKCIKGTACGFTCISSKLQCSDKILKRDADALINSVTKAKVKAKSETKSEDIADYKIEQEIGSGMFGRAVLTSRGTIVKIAEDDGILAPDDITREYESIKLLHRLGIGPEALGLDAGKLSIEMGYIKGRTYGEIGGLTNDDRMAVAVAVLKLHKAGYLHNDLHEGNVIKADADGSANVIDCGTVTKAGDPEGLHGWADASTLLRGHPVYTKLANALSKDERDYEAAMTAAYTTNDTGNKAKAAAKLKYHKAYLKVADKYIK